MINTKNMALANLCFMSSSSGKMPPKLSPISTKHWEMDILWTIQRYHFQKFCCVDQSLEDKKDRGQVCSLDNKQLPANC